MKFLLTAFAMLLGGHYVHGVESHNDEPTRGEQGRSKLNTHQKDALCDRLDSATNLLCHINEHNAATEDQKPDLWKLIIKAFKEYKLIPQKKGVDLLEQFLESTHVYPSEKKEFLDIFTKNSVDYKKDFKAKEELSMAMGTELERQDWWHSVDAQTTRLIKRINKVKNSTSIDKKEKNDIQLFINKGEAVITVFEKICQMKYDNTSHNDDHDTVSKENHIKQRIHAFQIMKKSMENALEGKEVIELHSKPAHNNSLFQKIALRQKKNIPALAKQEEERKGQKSTATLLTDPQQTKKKEQSLKKKTMLANNAPSTTQSPESNSTEEEPINMTMTSQTELHHEEDPSDEEAIKKERNIFSAKLEKQSEKKKAESGEQTRMTPNIDPAWLAKVKAELTKYDEQRNRGTE